MKVLWLRNIPLRTYTALAMFRLHGSRHWPYLRVQRARRKRLTREQELVQIANAGAWLAHTKIEIANVEVRPAYKKCELAVQQADIDSRLKRLQFPFYAITALYPQPAYCSKAGSSVCPT